MAGKMTRTQIILWLEKNGGQRRMDTEMVDVQNPDYHEVRNPNKTIKVAKRIWIANNGQRLEAIDTGKTTPVEGRRLAPQGTDEGEGPMPVEDEPVLEVVSEGDNPDDDTKDTRAPEKRADDEAEAREKSDNQRETGRRETNAERRTRERQEENDKQAVEARREANRLEAERNEIARAAEARAAGTATRQAETDAARTEIDRSRYELEGERVGLERQRTAAQIAKDEREANKPTFLSQADPDKPTIAVYNPATGQVEAQANPAYDEVKTAAARKREELTLAIQSNQMTATRAAEEYKRWFDQNVDLPFKQAQERRLQAQEQRQALEAEERRKQAAAENELGRAKLGQQAAGDMLQAETALNPYRVGPQFGEEMSAAIDSLAKGGTLNGPAANKGINFSAKAFEYKAPDLSKIAAKATAAALKGLSKYTPSDQTFATGDYSGIAMPDATTVQGAPAAPTYVDTNAMFQDYSNTRYAPPQEEPVVP